MPRMRAVGTGTRVVAAILVAALWPAAAGAARKPPPADRAAQVACQSIRLMDVAGASQSSLAGLVGTLRESRTKGAAKLAERLFEAPTGAAQEVARGEVRRWCLSTLRLRCSALECEGGHRVERIRRRR